MVYVLLSNRCANFPGCQDRITHHHLLTAKVHWGIAEIPFHESTVDITGDDGASESTLDIAEIPFHESVINLTEVARDEYISDCEYLISTIEKRSTVAIVDAASKCNRFAEIDISDLENKFHDIIHDIIHEQKCGIPPVIDRLCTCSLFENQHFNQ